MAAPERGAEPLTRTAPALVRPRLMRQRWRDAAFLHWALAPSAVERFMPLGVRPDVHEGVTYAGLIAFRMVGAGFAHGPAVPHLGTFLETNVRLYSVDATGRRGIVFLSLDTDRAAVVVGARTVFGLPYRWARMRHETRPVGNATGHRYTARLRGRRGAAGRSGIDLIAREPVEPTPLDDFLTARWGLHVQHVGCTWFVPNAHEPWPLRRADLHDLDDGLVASVGLPGLAARTPDHVRFSDGVRTEFGRPRLVSRRR